MTTARKISIVTANETTAKKAAPRKAAPRKTVVKKTITKWDNNWIPSIATYAMAMANSEKALASAQKSVNTARENIERVLGELRSAGIKIGGSRATCAIAKEIHAAFVSAGMSTAAANNALTGARDTVNNGKPFNLNPARAKAQAKKEAAAKEAAKEAKAKKGTAANAYKDVGTVLEALATAIQSVKSKAGAALWGKALATAPDGFDFAVADFLESQASDE